MSCARRSTRSWASASCCRSPCRPDGRQAGTRDDASSVEHILSAGRHLLKLVDEVLDLARIESGRMELSPEPVPVNLLLKEALSLIRRWRSDRGLPWSVGAVRPLRRGGRSARRWRPAAAEAGAHQSALQRGEIQRAGGSVTVVTRPGPRPDGCASAWRTPGRELPQDLRGRLFTPV